MTRLARVSMALFTAALVAQLCWASESVRVTVERANLRSGPSTDSRIVAKVEKGTVLQVLGREGAWVRVAAPEGGAAAYINARLCEPAAATGPAATASRPAAPEPSRSEAAFAPRERSSRAEPLQFGVNADWADKDIGLGLGARASAGIPAVPHLGGLLTLDYFFGARSSADAAGVEVETSGHSFQIGLLPTYGFEVGRVHGYVGAGLSYFRSSYSASEPAPAEPAVESSGSLSSTSLGIVAGAKFKQRFFGEVRYHFGDASHLTLSAGVVFDSPW